MERYSWIVGKMELLPPTTQAEEVEEQGQPTEEHKGDAVPSGQGGGQPKASGNGNPLQSVW